MQIFTNEKVEKFIRSLEKPAKAKIVRAVELLAEFGVELSMPHSRKVTKELFELRIRGQQEIRIFYFFRNNLAYLIHGFVKKSEKTPIKEIEIAKQRFRDLT